MNEKRTEICETCRYCEIAEAEYRSVTGYHTVNIHECRKYAKVYTSSGSGFPRVTKDEWCGEYEQKNPCKK